MKGQPQRSGCKDEHEVDEPKSNIAIIWTLIFEWYVIRCGFKNGHQKDMCFKELGLCVQNMPTVLNSTVNIVEEAYVTT